MTATADCSLGIDLGTTSTKVLLLDADGSTVASASAHHGIDPESSGVQADPRRWWTSTCEALDALAAQVDPRRIAAVGFSGNMSAVVLVDEHIEPLAPALLLADQRGEAQLAALDQHTRAQITARTGNTPSTVFSLSSLLWWQDAAPDVFGGAAAFLSAKDFLRARLTGRLVTDRTDAYNTLLLDTDGCWDADLIAALHLPEHIFPEVLGSGGLGGSVTAEAHEATGIPAGVPVAIGAGDVAAGITGMGGLAEDELAVSLGTSATITSGWGGDRPDGFGAVLAGAVTRHPAADGSWLALGSLLTGGLVVNWLRDAVGAPAIAAAGDVPDPANPLLFLPYLAGTGSPDFDGSASGTVVGITPATTPDQLVSAALEAVAFDLAGLIERLGTAGRQYRSIVASGGGTRIAAWPQIIADVTGLPVRVMDDPDLSAVGAAVLGWSAAGRQVRPAHVERRVEPRAEHAEAWRARRQRFELARPVILDLGHRLSPPGAASPSQKAAS